MESKKVAAIASAVSSYLQMEEQARARAGRPVAGPGAWVSFLRQELMRSRLNWRINKIRK